MILQTNICMEGFVKIKSVYTSAANRTVDALKEIYDQNEFLIQLMVDLTGEELSENKVCGKKVLLKPNWVKHSSNSRDEICLRTHNNFVLAVLEVILKKSPASVVIGDAPIQGCNWNKMMTSDFSDQINVLSRKYQVPVMIKDFRRTAFDTVANKVTKEINSIDQYLIFDVGKESYLEPITSVEKNEFRVTQYDPDRLIESHAPGMHKYCITKELFEADIVISLPKVKTHQKTGLTAALKNIVGLNGDKDYLPHHRLGGTEMGGDCYPGKNYLRYWSELALDNANRKKGTGWFLFWQKLSSLLWKISLPGKKHHLAAGWYGNDTTWRMVMDLNKIIIFGKSDGSLSKTPQRVLYSLCDGIVGGQGDGPLKPDPLNLGVICFTDDSPWADLSLATLMGIEIEKIPLLVCAKGFRENRAVSIFWEGKKTTLQDLRKNAVHAILSPGWTDYQKAK